LICLGKWWHSPKSNQLLERVEKHEINENWLSFLASFDKFWLQEDLMALAKPQLMGSLTIFSQKIPYFFSSILDSAPSKNTKNETQFSSIYCFSLLSSNWLFGGTMPSFPSTPNNVWVFSAPDQPNMTRRLLRPGLMSSARSVLFFSLIWLCCIFDVSSKII